MLKKLVCVKKLNMPYWFETPCREKIFNLMMSYIEVLRLYPKTPIIQNVPTCKPINRQPIFSIKKEFENPGCDFKTPQHKKV